MSPLDEQTPTRETPNTVSAALPILRELEKKVLWLSTWMIHHANNVRQNRGGLGGLKVGGHQASSASVAALMTALYFHELRPQDRVAVKPHASPVFHAIQYLFGNQTRRNLKNFRAFGGAQSYPSRTKDSDDVDISTGSVGLGPAMTVFASLAQDYLRRHTETVQAQDPGRMIAIVGEIVRDTGEQILIFLTRKQIAVGQGFLAEFGQQRIAAFIDLHVETAIENLLAVFLGRLRSNGRNRAGKSFARGFLNQLFATVVGLVHGDRLLLGGGLVDSVVRIQIQCHRRVVPALEIHRQPRRSKCLTGSPATLRVPLVFESARPVPCLAISSRRGVGIYPHSPHSPALSKGVPDMGSMPSKARSCGSPWQSDH